MRKSAWADSEGKSSGVEYTYVSGALLRPFGSSECTDQPFLQGHYCRCTQSTGLDLPGKAKTGNCPGSSTPVMEAAERERWLNDQPVAVLRAHAQECGINTAGCIEKYDLVQRILHHELRSFGAPAQPSRGLSAEVATGAPFVAPVPSAAPVRPQSAADLAEDERLARRLQAEEASRAEVLQAQQRESRRGLDGGSSRRQQVLETLAMAGGGAERLAQQQRHLQQQQHEQQQHQHHQRRMQQMQELQERLQEQQREARQRQHEHRGGSIAGGAIGGAGNDPSGESVMQLLELLARGQRGGGSGGGTRVPRASNPHLPEVMAPDRGPPGAQRRAGGPEALQMVLGQLLAGNVGGPAGTNMLAEVLASLQQQQGIDQAGVAARTGEMVYREPEGGSSGAEGGSGSAGAEERTCMVCLEGFTAGEDLRILPCLHRYHKTCIDPWLARNRHCPVCKHDVTQ